jgi:hypothetical protein
MPDQPESQATVRLDEQVVAEADLPIRRSSDYHSVYADHMKFGATAFEISITFSQISETVEGQLYVDQKIRVMLSPLAAKILAAVLTQNVDNFEKLFGAIQIPGGTIPTHNEKPTPAPK